MNKAFPIHSLLIFVAMAALAVLVLGGALWVAIVVGSVDSTPYSTGGLPP